MGTETEKTIRNATKTAVMRPYSERVFTIIPSNSSLETGFQKLFKKIALSI